MVAPGTRSRALLYCIAPTQWKTIRQVARAFQASATYEPVVFFDRNRSNVPFERDLRECISDGVAALDEQGPITLDRIPAIVGAGVAPPPLAVRALHGLVGRNSAMWNGVVQPLLAFPDTLVHGVRRHSFARALLARQRISALVLPVDSVGYDTPLWIAAAHELQIPSIIVPFSTNTPAGVAANLRLTPEADARRWFNRPLSLLAPKWVYRDGDRSLVRESGGKALALHALGVDPPNPWVLHSGAADAIVAETERVRTELLEQGLPHDRVEVTGALADDLMAPLLANESAHRAALYAELGLPTDRPMALGSLCDYSRYFDLGGDYDGFRDARELIEFWVDTLVDTGHNAVLSLHPWMKYEDWRFLEERGARISRRPIEQLVPLCDFFLVSVSVTVRLAIACGKPVVNHDVLRFRIGDYADAGGVFTVDDRESVRTLIWQLASDPTFYDRAEREQALAQPRYGVLDGKCGDRLIALIDRLRRTASH